MEDLKPLVKLISIQKIKQIEIISEIDDDNSPSIKLYKGILSGHYESDDEALLDIYGSKSKSDSYQKLKYRLKQKLINTLFFIDAQGYSKSNYSKALHRNYKNIAAIKILLDKGIKKPAINLCEISLKAALQYDITDVTILILPKLMRHYGIFEYDKRRYKKYAELLEKMQLTFNAEIDADKIYVKTVQQLLQGKSTIKTEKLLALEHELNVLLTNYKLVDSFEYKFLSLSASYFLNTIKNDYKALDEICKLALEYFESKVGFSNFCLFDFNLKFSVVHIYFKRYDQAELTLDKCDRLNLLIGNYNWFIIKSYKVFNYLIQKKYNQALPLLESVVLHKKFKTSYALFRQQWLLKEGYFHFLIKAKRINSELAGESNLKPFKLSKFLNEVDLLIKDKKGLNIPVLVIEILYYLIEGKEDLLESRLGALSQYNYRYLKDKNRSHYFLKMLSALPDMEYNIERIRKKVDKYYTKLQETPMEYTEEEIQIEIIPYEDLWEIILGIIKS